MCPLQSWGSSRARQSLRSLSTGPGPPGTGASLLPLASADLGLGTLGRESRVWTLSRGTKGQAQKGQVVLRLESSGAQPAMISSSYTSESQARHREQLDSRISREGDWKDPGVSLRRSEEWRRLRLLREDSERSHSLPREAELSEAVDPGRSRGRRRLSIGLRRAGGGRSGGSSGGGMREVGGWREGVSSCWRRAPSPRRGVPASSCRPPALGPRPLSPSRASVDWALRAEPEPPGLPPGTGSSPVRLRSERLPSCQGTGDPRGSRTPKASITAAQKRMREDVPQPLHHLPLS